MAAFLIAVVVGVVLSPVSPWQVSVLAGWAAGAATFVGSVAARVWRLSGDDTALHATAEDDSRAVADVIVLCAAIASLAAIGLALVKASNAHGAGKAAIIAVAALAVAAAWVSVQTVFTLRYARLYYAEGGGIDFNADDVTPDYHDFAYVAFTVGMTFQIADTDVTSPVIRRTVTRHALVSYVLGAVVVAMAINVVSGLLNR